MSLRLLTGWRQPFDDGTASSVGLENPLMEHPLIIAVLLVMGFNLGLLLMRVFGPPGDVERLEDASVRLRRGAPSPQ